MALRLLRLLNHWFTLAVFWSYLVAFALAFTMVLVFFPVGALALLLGGIFTLPAVVIVSLGLSAWERAWCRRWLRAERCPQCGCESAIHHWSGTTFAEEDLSLRNEGERPSYECRRCGALFAASGEGAEAPLAAA